MKKWLIVLLVLLVAAPAMAGRVEDTIEILNTTEVNSIGSDSVVDFSGDVDFEADVDLQDNVTFSGTAPYTSIDVGAKNGATVTAVEYGDGVIHKVVLTLAATPVTITDDAGQAQYGGVKIYTMPAGVSCILGAVVDASATLGATGTITTTWAGGVALGSATATTGADLTGTEENIMPEVDVAAATAKVAVIDGHSVATALTESGARWIDGHTTPVPVYLNLVVDDEGSHTSGTGTITGTVTLTYVNLGDY